MFDVKEVYVVNDYGYKLFGVFLNKDASKNPMMV